MTLYKWMQAAGSNATADSTINWAEGQAPSTINDSARAMMAAAAKYRDDTSGSLITGGTSTAYTVASNQGFASKLAMNGVEISFTIHMTNGASPTLNVDSLGGDPITLDGVSPVPTGTLLAGSIYTAMYYNSGNAWRVKNFYQLPFIVPVGGMIDYFGTSAPGSNFVFPYGQAISRSTYSVLFGLLTTTFGTGDGSTTFNIPDLRGRIAAGKDDMGGSAANRIGSVSTDGGTISGTTLGSVGGSATHALTTGEMPTHSHSNTLTDPGHQHKLGIAESGTAAVAGVGASGEPNYVHTDANFASQSAMTGITINNASAGSGSAHALLQPTIILNKLIRII